LAVAIAEKQFFKINLDYIFMSSSDQPLAARKSKTQKRKGDEIALSPKEDGEEKEDEMLIPRPYPFSELKSFDSMKTLLYSDTFGDQVTKGTRYQVLLMMLEAVSKYATGNTTMYICPPNMYEHLADEASGNILSLIDESERIMVTPHAYLFVHEQVGLGKTIVLVRDDVKLHLPRFRLSPTTIYLSTRKAEIKTLSTETTLLVRRVLDTLFRLAWDKNLTSVRGVASSFHALLNSEFDVGTMTSLLSGDNLLENLTTYMNSSRNVGASSAFLSGLYGLTLESATNEQRWSMITKSVYPTTVALRSVLNVIRPMMPVGADVMKKYHLSPGDTEFVAVDVKALKPSDTILCGLVQGSIETLRRLFEERTTVFVGTLDTVVTKTLGGRGHPSSIPSALGDAEFSTMTVDTFRALKRTHDALNVSKKPEVKAPVLSIKNTY